MAGIVFDELKQQANWYSDAVSTSVRATAFGVIAALWAILTAQGIELNVYGILCIPTFASIRASFFFSSATLLTDLAHYIVAYRLTHHSMRQWESLQDTAQVSNFEYSEEYIGAYGMRLYAFSKYLFNTKIIFVGSAAISFFLVTFSISLK